MQVDCETEQYSVLIAGHLVCLKLVTALIDWLQADNVAFTMITNDNNSVLLLACDVCCLQKEVTEQDKKDKPAAATAEESDAKYVVVACTLHSDSCCEQVQPSTHRAEE